MAVTLDSGPMWVLVVEQMAPAWCAETAARMPVQALTLAVGPDGPVVAGRAVGDRLGCAWGLTVALVELAADPCFAGVPVVIRLGALEVLVPAEVLAGVVAGEGRRWWRERVTLSLTPAGPSAGPA